MRGWTPAWSDGAVRGDVCAYPCPVESLMLNYLHSAITSGETMRGLFKRGGQ